MKVIRVAAFFLVAVVLCEFVAITAVSYSYLNSILETNKLVSNSNEQRISELSIGLSKALESKILKKDKSDLNKIFDLLLKRLEKEKTKLPVGKITVIDSEYKILKEIRVLELHKTLNLKDPEFANVFRMRKWQTPRILVLEKNKPPLHRYLLKGLDLLGIFLSDATYIASIPVYHDVRLDIVGAIFISFKKSNLEKIVSDLTKIYEPILLGNMSLSFCVSLVLTLLFYLIGFGEKISKPADSTPLIETTKSTEISLETEKEIPEAIVSEEESSMESQMLSVNPDMYQNIPKAEEIKKAIYLGR